MRKNFALIVLTSLLTVAFVIKGSSDLRPIKASYEINQVNNSFKVDTEKSSIFWTGRKTFGKHIGTIDIKEGFLKVNDNQITEGEFYINMESIKNKDIDDPELKKKLMNQLRSEDFFNVERFPVSIFRLSSVIQTEKKNQFLIIGELEIKGISKKINFPAEIIISAEKVLAKASFEIDRTLWNIRFGSGYFFDNIGDSMINDNIKLTLNIRAKPIEISSN